MSPKVAIITRTKDRPELLKRAIASVQGQTFKDWEHIIVNDGGNAAVLDALLKDLPEAETARIRVIHHAESRGMQIAANVGIGESESEYICIHDDDDDWAPQFLRRVIRFLDQEGPESRYQGVVTGVEEVREAISPEGKAKEISRKPYIPLAEISLFRMGYENPFPPIAFCYRRAAWNAIGGYDPRWDVIGDMDFNLRFLLRYEIAVINTVLAYYRIREDGGSEAMANSISLRQDLHKRLFTEFKNEPFRRKDSPESPALALALNISGYLVEAQWMLHDIFHRGQAGQRSAEKILSTLTDHSREDIIRLDQAAEARKALAKRLEELVASIGLEGKDDRFANIRGALNILIDHARDTGVRDGLVDLQKGLEHAAEARSRFTARLEKVIASIGLPTEADEAVSLRAAMKTLLAESRDPAVKNGIEALLQAVQASAEAQARQAARLEELVASIGLPAEGDRFQHLREALNTLLSHAEDPGLRDGLTDLQAGLEHAAEVRHRQASRLEELIASVGLADEAPLHDKFAKWEQRLDAHAREAAAREKLIQAKLDDTLAKLQDGLAKLAELEERQRALWERRQYVKFGPLQLPVKERREPPAE